MGATVVGTSIIRASLVGASVVGASVVGAIMVGSTIIGATVVGISIIRASHIKTITGKRKQITSFSIAPAPLPVLAPVRQHWEHPQQYNENRKWPETANGLR